MKTMKKYVYDEDDEVDARLARGCCSRWCSLINDDEAEMKMMITETGPVSENIELRADVEAMQQTLGW